MIALVALDIPFSKPFDYIIPDTLLVSVKIGVRVHVSFGPRMMIGIVVEIQQQSSLDRLKTIIDIVDTNPLFDRRLLAFTKWVSEYYLCGWGEVLEAALPTGLKPKIEKRIDIQENHSDFSNLPDDQKKWLLNIKGKKQSNVWKSLNSSGDKTFYNHCKKQGVITFIHVCSKKFHTNEKEAWLSIHPETDNKTASRKGGKPFRILALLKEEKSIRRKELLERIPSANSALNLLIKKGVALQEERDVFKNKPPVEIKEKKFIRLNQEQKSVVEIISEAVRNNLYKTFLLHGVTGSGKTEVYLYAVREIIQQGRTALILIPEISLTPQAVRRFKDRFGENIAVLHSGMAEKERSNEWLKIKDQRCQIVIGARSAIFAPLKNIGLIVVDEEHDGSYKQQETPYYNARDAAVKIASEQNAVVILGTATPSLESRFNVEKNKYTMLSLKQRANKKPLPVAEVINLKEEKRQSGIFYLSQHLVSRLKENLASGKQALIFLNRRGYASFLTCVGCDLPLLCRNCTIALTWHKTQQSLICHHCGFQRSYPKICPACNGKSFKLEGIGTQRIERDLKILFPDSGFLRMDRDTIRKRGLLENYIDLINDQKVDFIIGTQLISKGHDFKHIGIVCIILADMSLNIPDFRSSERSFQLISQVSGRAGRGGEGVGLTLIQSYNPEHYAVKNAVRNDFSSFYQHETELRKTLDNPPFTRQILLKISSKNAGQAKKTAQQLGSNFRQKEGAGQFTVLGPIESPIQKINNRYYWQILLKSINITRLKSLVHRIFWDKEDWTPHGSVRISIDVDPYVML